MKQNERVECKLLKNKTRAINHFPNTFPVSVTQTHTQTLTFLIRQAKKSNQT